jgi:hypothetical protein
MATTAAEHRRHRKKENFLRKFRDEQSQELKQLTATQFMEIWSHYDIDGRNRISTIFFLSIHLGNGYIEGHELDDLLQELASSLNVNDTSSEVSGLFLSEILDFFCYSFSSFLMVHSEN